MNESVYDAFRKKRLKALGMDENSENNDKVIGTPQQMLQALENEQTRQESYQRGQQIIEAQRARDTINQAVNNRGATYDLGHGDLPSVSNAQAFRNQQRTQSLDDTLNQIMGNNVLTDAGRVSRAQEAYGSLLSAPTVSENPTAREIADAYRQSYANNNLAARRATEAVEENKPAREQQNLDYNRKIGTERRIGQLEREIAKAKDSATANADERIPILSEQLMNESDPQKQAAINHAIKELGTGQTARVKELQSQLDEARRARYAVMPYESDFTDNSGFDEKNASAIDKRVNGITPENYDPLEDLADNYIDFMTTEQRGTYNYLRNTKGQHEADNYLAIIRPNLEKQRMDEASEKAQQFGYEHPRIAEAASVLMSPTRGTGTVGAVGSAVAGKGVRENAIYNLPSTLIGGARSGALARREEELTELLDNPQQWAENQDFYGGPLRTVLQKVSGKLSKNGVSEKTAKDIANFMTELHGSTLSQLDSLWSGILAQNMVGSIGGMDFQSARQIKQLAEAAPDMVDPAMALRASRIVEGAEDLTRAVMGMGAVSDTIKNAKAKGLDDDKAFALGMIAGFAEYATEKWSIGNLFESDWTKPTIVKMLQQGGFEWLEEIGSGLINETADLILAQDKSELMQAYNKHKREGMADNKAFALALGERGIEPVKEGFFAFLTTGGSVALTSARQNAANPQTIHNKVSAADKKSGGNVGATVDGMLSDLINKPREEWASGLADVANQFRGAVKGNPMNTVRDYLRETARNQIDAYDRGAYNALADFLTPFKDENGTVTDNRDAVWRMAEERSGTSQQPESVQTPAASPTAGQEQEISDQATENPSEKNTVQNRPADASESVPENEAAVTEPVQKAADEIPAPAQTAPSAERTVTGNRGETNGARLAATALNFDREADPETAAVALLRRYSTPENLKYGISKTAIDDVRRKISNAIRNGQYTAEEADALRAYGNRVTDALRNRNDTLQKKANVMEAALRRTYGLQNLTIKVDPSLAQDTDFSQPLSRGYHKGDAIYLNPLLDTDEAIAGVVAHELFHDAKANDARKTLLSDIEKYLDALNQKGGRTAQGGKLNAISDREFVQAYADLIWSDFTYTEAGSDFLNRYGAEHPDASGADAVLAMYDAEPERFFTDFWQANSDGETVRDYISEEKGAHFIEELARSDSGEFMSTLLSEDKNLFRRIVDAVRSLLKLPAKARKFSNEEGYRRLIDRFEKAVSNAVGEEQVSRDENAPAELSDIPPSGSFKMSREVERVGDLIAVHNLTEDKYLETHKLGGFPAPSIAVVKAKTGHSDYGPISVVFGADTIDPQKDSRNRIYGGDAWTPTFPDVEYNINRTFVANVNNALYQYMIKLPETDPFPNTGKLTQYVKKDAMTHILSTLEWGDTVDTVIENASHNNAIALAYIGAKNDGFEVPNNYRTNQQLDQLIEDNAPVEEVKNWIRPIIEKITEEKGIRIEEDRPNRPKKSFNETHVPVTAENVVRAMYQQQSRRGEKIAPNAQGISSLTIPEYNSLDEVRSDKDRLRRLNVDDYEDIVRRMDNYISDVIEDIADYNNVSSDSLGMENAIMSAARSDHSADSITNSFDDYSLRINPNQIRVLQTTFNLASQLPTEYFEAKPERVVGFDEVLYYIVPDQGSLNVLKMMEKDGAEIRTYEAGNEKDRLRVLNSLKGVRFSREVGAVSEEDRQIDSDYIKAVLSEDEDAAQKIIKEAAEKNGYTVEAYHGTKQFGFTVPNVSKSDDGISFFVTADINTASTYSGIDAIRQINAKEYRARIGKKINESFKEVERLLVNLSRGGEDDIHQKLESLKELVLNSPDSPKQLIPRIRFFETIRDIYKEYIYTPRTSSYNLFNGLEENTEDDGFLAYDEWIDSDEFLEIEDGIENILYYYKQYASNSGNYHVYINTDNLLVVNGNGANWNDIRFKATEKHPVLNWNTRELAQYAKENGYSGVLYRNITDDGGQNEDTYVPPADVYALFNPQSQVKSADPVTYDGDAIILPSQRFNPRQGDMRYSREINTEQTETEAFKRWFGDWQNDPENASKIVNEDGTPKVMYRGDSADFTVFDRRKSRGSNLYGRGFYFTDSETHAGQYGTPKAYYLDVKNPLTPGQNTITRKQMRAFLEAVQENEDDYDFLNYGRGATVESVLDDMWGKGDFEMLQDVNSTAIGDLVAAIELFNEVNGTAYDGIITPTETVVFNSNQIKSATDNIGTFDRNNPDVRYSREINEEESAKNAKTALDYFGKTYSWNETGYNTRNGDRLDFSGKRDGAPAGSRSMDHREISDAFEDDYGGDDYSGGMIRFMSEGNIRIMPESGGINIQKEPSEKQYARLGEFIQKNRGEVILDLDDENGVTVESRDYPSGTRSSKVLNDIREYFANGSLPDEDTRFSREITPEQDAEYMAAVESGDTEKQQRMVDEAAEAAGYTQKWAHGSPNAMFTSFDLSKARGAKAVFLSDPFTASGYAKTSYAPMPLNRIGKTIDTVDDALTEINRIQGKMFTPKLENGVYKLGRREYSEKELIDYANGIKRRHPGGVYSLYVNPGKQLVVDAKRRQWNEIKSDYGRSTDAIGMWAQSHGYDSVLIENVHDSVDYTVLPSDVLLVFDGNRLKSTDPVTYDESGNPIPLSERFNSENDDIRYSRELETVEQRENRQLKKQLEESEQKVEYLKKQWTARTAFGEARAIKPDDFNKEVRRLKDMMKYSIVNDAEIRKGLRELFDIFERPLKGRNDTAQSRWAEAEAKAEELAREWAGAATLEKVVNPEFEENLETYRDIYAKLRTYKGFYVVPEMTAEAGDKESLRQLRKSLSFMGLLGVQSNKEGVESGRMSVDQIFTDLSRSYPGFFGAEGELEGGELNGDYAKLQRIAEVGGMAWEAAHDPYTTVPTMDEQQAAVLMKDDLLHRFFEISTPTKASARPTENDSREAFAQGRSGLIGAVETAREEGYSEGYKKGKFENEAEVAAAQMREDMMEQRFAEDAEHLKKTLNKIIDDREDRIVKLEKRLVKRGWMDRARVERNGVMRNLNKLNRLLENPTRKQHIPQGLRASTAKLLETVGNTRLPNGKTIFNGRMQQIQADEMEKMRNFAHEIQIGLAGAKGAENGGNIAATEGFLLQLADKINALEDYYNRAIGAEVDMSLRTDDVAVTQNVDFLHALNQILTMAVHAIDQANNFIINGKAITAAELGSRLVDSIADFKAEGYGRQKRSALRAAASGAGELLRDMGYETMSPDQLFGTMGKPWEEIAHSYREGQNRQAQHEAVYIDYMKKLLGGYDNMAAKRELIPISINGKTVNTTRAQLMQLYATYQRPAGRTHLEQGGAAFADDKGRTSNRFLLRITPEVYDALMSNLTDEDKRIADGLVRFMSDECAEWGNDASMYMYGFRMYEDPHYIPLDVEMPESIAETMRKNGKSIENASFTNKLKRDSKTPLRMTDIFDVTNNHVRRMAAYNAYAPITNDLNRILKMSDVAQTVTEKMGRRGLNYITKFAETVAANEVRNGEMAASAAPLTAMMNAYKRQAVAWNVSTMLKQPLSIFRAANEIDGKYLAKANVGKDEYERIKKTMLERSGTAYLKENGYSDTGLGKSMEKLYTDPKKYVNDAGFIRGALSGGRAGRNLLNAYDWLTEKGMAGAAKADEMTWVRIWKACELEVDDKNPDLSGEERLKKITERFNDVIGKTQVVDTILDTSPLMKNKAMQIFTPFMNEPTKTLGSLVAAANDLRNGKTGAKKAFGKAIGLWAVGNILLEPLITSMMQMWRDEKDDTDGFLWSLLEHMLGIKKDGSTTGADVFTSNMVSGALSFPIVNILYDAVANKLQGFGSGKLDTEAISNLVDASGKLNEGMRKAPEDRAKSMYRLWGDWAESVAAFAGLPAKTVRRQIAGTARAIMDFTDSDWAKWQYNKLYYNLENASARSEKNFYDILASTYKRGDAETYRKMLGELNEIVTATPSVVSAKTIQQAIEKRGGEIQPGDPMWNVSVQARFRLDQPVTGGKVENFITKTYLSAKREGLDETAYDDVLLNMPDAYEYEDDNGDDIKMTAAQYDVFVSDVGDLSYKILTELASSGNADAWNSLNIDQQIYAFEKAYAYAKAKFKKDINPDYNINGQGKWMSECYYSNARPAQIASSVMNVVAGYENQKKRKKEKSA